jgi:RNA polymerase sigma factor (sigma-70 family)
MRSAERARHSEPDFDDLFRSEFTSVFQAARLVVGDVEVARDITQEAFTKLFVHWQKVARYDRPGAWVRRVAIRDAIRIAARNDRARGATDAFIHDRSLNGPGPEDDRGDRLERVIAAIGELSPQQRATVALYYLDGLRLSEVAVLIGTTEATAKVHLHRARQRLGTLLNEEVPDVVG